MAIIKETGIGVANANSYQELAEAVAYLKSMGYTALEAAGSAGEGFLVRATATVDASISQHGSPNSQPVSEDQGLHYPRREAWPASASGGPTLYHADEVGLRQVSGVPDQVIKATAMRAEAFAIRASSELLNVPTNVLEVEQAKGVRTKLSGKRGSTYEVESLDATIRSLLRELVTTFRVP